jgi:excisionase family DNA binding protein
MKKNNSKPTNAPAPQQGPESRALTIPQLAQYLNMKNWHVEEILRKGEIPFRWIGKRKIVDRKDADAYFDALPYASEEHRKLRELNDDELQQFFAFKDRQEQEKFLAFVALQKGVKIYVEEN